MRQLVYLVRHGETNWNDGGWIQGHADVPLNAVGRAQAAQVAQRLVREGASALYSSDLLRAYETAQIIGRATGLRVIQKTAFREMHFGRWQGLSSPQIAARDPDLYAARLANPYDVPPPGGETWKQFYQRVVTSLQDVLQTSQVPKIIVAAHSGVCTALGLEALGLGYTGQRTFGNANCGLHTLAVEEGRWQAVTLNETAHLDASLEL